MIQEFPYLRAVPVTHLPGHLRTAAPPARTAQDQYLAMWPVIGWGGEIQPATPAPAPVASPPPPPAPPPVAHRPLPARQVYATHEAAHAVVGYLLGLEVRRVELDPTDVPDAAGAARIGFDDNDPDQLTAIGVSTAAGPLVSRAMGDLSSVTTLADEVALVTIASRLAQIDPGRPRPDFAALARRELARPGVAAALTDVAHYLQSCGALDGDQVAAIVLQHVGQ